jgi:7-cyano-7-deazaguanine synthase in queuosine biosynthesis
MIDLEKYPDDIALLFSGGVDSTLLFYLLSVAIRDHYPNKRLTLYIIDRYNNPVSRAKIVYNNIVKITTLPVELKLLTIPSVVQQQEIMIASKIIRKNHPIVICGFNKYPSDPSIRPKHIVSVKDSNNVKFPLAQLEKDKIVQEFFNLGIEDLLPLTHSCGSNQSEPCRECFNCRERIWAYNSLNKQINLGL